MKSHWRTLAAVLALPACVAFAIDPQPQHSPLPSATDFSSTLLPERPDVVSWKVLGQVTPGNENGKIVPVFTKTILALDKKDVKVQGFMVPIEPDPKHKHFVLSAVPPSCAFCMPAGPEAMVEVRLKNGIDYNDSPIIVSGKFSVRNDDPRGVFYILTDGVTVSSAPAP
jgi:hypothetical protein